MSTAPYTPLFPEFIPSHISWLDRIKLIGTPMQIVTDNSGGYRTTIHLKERNGITYILKEERIKLSTFTLLEAAKRAGF